MSDVLTGTTYEREKQGADRTIAPAERYATPLPEIETHIASLEDKVNNHLKEMGFEL